MAPIASLVHSFNPNFIQSSVSLSDHMKVVGNNYGMGK
jgi:hypothetical protein